MILHTYKKNWYGRPLAPWLAAFCVFCILGLIFDPDHVGALFYGLLAFLFGIGAMRSLRSGELIQTDDRLTVRGLRWTHRVSRDLVARFTIESGSLRFGPLGGSFLVAELKNGTQRPFRDFNERPGDEGIRSLEQVAAALNSAWQLR